MTDDAPRARGWTESFTGRYFIKDDPDIENLYWFVVIHEDRQWYWHMEQADGTRVSSEYGPFFTWREAAINCETLHEETRP